MSGLKVCFALLSLATFAGCVAYAGPDPYEDRHRAWWAEHHREEMYERERAYHDHRGWCEDHDGDDSCQGWYHR
ncbi:MAG: hypothetical protein EPO08_02980 [Rhodospirillaceae bacterium]|nr:MAG: hypothetical protein EPO08_02980 [Rhodospirillaceae bacterium]